jgi:glutathione peroxidase-family protein
VVGYGQQTLVTQFAVTDKPQLLAPGDQAFATKNLTVHSKGADPASIDSRALDGAPIPDRDLHEWTVADALKAHRPILLIVATPTYCTSQFCGPDTDAVANLAKTYSDRAVFIHIEVYKTKPDPLLSTQQQFNAAALQWIQPVGTEPWMWLIGADGKIIDRWSPVWDPNEVAQELAKLPKMG